MFEDLKLEIGKPKTFVKMDSYIIFYHHLSTEFYFMLFLSINGVFSIQRFVGRLEDPTNPPICPLKTGTHAVINLISPIGLPVHLGRSTEGNDSQLIVAIRITMVPPNSILPGWILVLVRLMGG